MLATFVAVALAMVTGTGGVVYAADGAVPGDVLYGVDRTVESVRLSLASEPEAAVGLLLEFAQERLLEAEELSVQGDEENLQSAVSSYGETILSVARTLDSAEDVDEVELVSLLDEAFSVHEEQLTRIFGDRAEAEDNEPEDGEPADDESGEGEGDGTDDGDEGGQGDGCVGVDPHPVGDRLSETHGVSYDDVMTWFCDGFGFGEIMHALKTSEAAGVSSSAEDLLAMKTEMGGWGKVWQELGLIGKPAHGPDDDAPDDGADDDVPDDEPDGTVILPDDEPGGGPPDDKPGGGPPDDKPGGGPPDDKPGGGPPDDGADDDVPDDEPDGTVVLPDDEPGGGPADDKPGGGPPEDKPGGGPPDDKPGGGRSDDKPGGGPPDDRSGGGPPDDKPGGGPPTNAGHSRSRGRGRKR